MSPSPSALNAVPAGSTSTSTPQSYPNLNMFLTKKTITQGLLDVALLTANIAQLKYVLSLGASGANGHIYYYPMVILITLSIVLQVSTGLCLILLGKSQVNDQPTKNAELLNNLITGQVFLITVLNIMISTFNIEETVTKSTRLSSWIHDKYPLYENACSCADPTKLFYQVKDIAYNAMCTN